MSDLIASNLALAFGAHSLFDDVSMTLEAGDRVALVGPNGAGKTTLLRVLAGVLAPDSGEIRVPDHLFVALHDQRPERSEKSLLEFVSPERMVVFEKRMSELEIAMATGDEKIMLEYQDVSTAYEIAGGADWVNRVSMVMRGLGFSDEHHGQALNTLSGGELTRASLARALASSPDILFLDEPTNHLDIESIEWLQDYLQELPGACIIVSHDRWFIEATCSSVIEIVGGKARRFQGSFSEYRVQQAMEAVTFQRELEKWQVEMARLQRFVDKFSAGTRSRQAQSRVKMMEKLRQDTPEYSDLRNRRSLSFRLPTPERSGATVFDVRGLSLGFDDDPERGTSARTLLVPTDFVIERGEKVALIGRNGMGKSTILHSIASQCIMHSPRPDGMRDGEVRLGYNSSVRMISQHDSELHNDWTLLASVSAMSDNVGKRDAMSLLGLFGFSAKDAERKVLELSGGERRRLLLAMALTGSANVLLLDEPTNHLDLESREALEAAITEFAGTVLMISHDRALVEGAATRTVVLHEQTLKTVPGGYTAAHEMLAGITAKPALSASAPLKTEKKAPKTSAAPQASRTVRKRDSGSARRERNNRKSQRVRRPATIEKEIETLEAEFAVVQAQMLDPEIFTSPEKSADVLNSYGDLEKQIAARYDELEKSLEHFE